MKDYSKLVLKLPILSHKEAQEILAEAPWGTVLQVTLYGDTQLYARHGEEWVNLEELETFGPAYLTYESWAVVRDSDSLAVIGDESNPASLIRWGEG